MKKFGMNSRLAICLVLIFAAGIYVANAAYTDLLDDADASHATVARAIIERGEWIILYMDGIRYLTKAPLHYWTVALTYRLLGANSFATRFPVALSMVGLAFLAYVFSRRFFGERAGFYSGLVICTGAGFFLFTRIMIPEAIYALEFTAIFYLFLRGWTGTIEPRYAYWSVAALTAIAVLTRGLIGVIFPVAIIGLFITLTQNWHRWRELHLFSSCLIFLAISAPWHILASLRAETFVWSYFINEHFRRAVGTRYPPDYEAVPLWLWLGAHFIWFFPWSVFVPGVIGTLPNWRAWQALPAAGQARLLLVIWAVFILFFFSMTFGSRMEYYSFGAWPAIGILLGSGLAEAEEDSKRWVPRAQAILAGIGTGIAIILGTLLWLSAKVNVDTDISRLLDQHVNDVYRVSMAHILDLTPSAFAALRLPSLLAAVTFFIGFGAAWWLRRKQRPVAATLTTTVSMMVFMIAANIALGDFGPYLSTRALAQRVIPQLRPEDTVAIYGEYDASSSVAFYTNRHLLIWNGKFNNLEAGSYYPDAPHIFLNDADFLKLWSRDMRVFLFVQAAQREEARKRLPQTGTYLLSEIGGKALYCNQPLPL